MSQVQGNDPVEDRGQQVLDEHHHALLESLHGVVAAEAGLEAVLRRAPSH